MKRLIIILGLFISFSLGTFAQSQDIRGKRVIVDQSLFLKHWVDSILNDTTSLGPNTLLTSLAVSDLISGRLANAGKQFDPYNGLRFQGDSLRLGGDADLGLVWRLNNIEKQGNTNSRILITNDTLTSGNVNYTNFFNQGTQYSGELLKVVKVFREQRGDTLNLQYGGAIQALYDKIYDSTSAVFAAGNKHISLNNLGFYGQARFYPPRDSVEVLTSTFGATGSVFAAALGFGDSYGYNLNVRPSNASSNPDLPISVNKMEIDFVREIDQTRRKKMTGTGVTSYFSDWKFLQSTINGSTPAIGNYISKVRGFHAYGGVYTQVGGALTKEQIFAVAKVDTSVGLWVSPQRRALNEVNSGYGFVIEGADDYNYIAGSLKVAGTMPTRDNGGQTETVDVTGSVLGRTAVIGGQRVSNNSYLQVGRPDRSKPIYSFGDFLSDGVPGVTHLKDTIGTGYTKKPRLMQNDMRYYLNDDFASFNDAALETNLLMFYVQDSMEINNAAASASTVTGQRNQITISRHSTQSNPSKVKQSGTTPSKAVAVTTSTLLLGSTNIKLDGWWSGFNSIVSSANSGDTVAHFAAFNSIADNATSGRISKHVGLNLDHIPNADSLFGINQNSTSAFNRFAGKSRFGDLTIPQATVDIAGTLRYVDGNQQAGYVLKSDEDGNATWQAESGGGGGAVSFGGYGEIPYTNSGSSDFNYNSLFRYFDGTLFVSNSSSADTLIHAPITTANQFAFYTDMSAADGVGIGLNVDDQDYIMRAFSAGSKSFNIQSVISGGVYQIQAINAELRLTGSSGKINLNTNTTNNIELNPGGFMLYNKSGGATANAPIKAWETNVTTTGTASAGFGFSSEHYLENASGSNILAGKLELVWTDATAASEDSKWEFKTRSAGSETTDATVENGSLSLRNYLYAKAPAYASGGIDGMVVVNSSTNRYESVPYATGTYTPTATGITNVEDITVYALNYIRVGNTVTVFGRIEIDPTTSATATSLRISLPVASNFATNGDGVGTGNEHIVGPMWTLIADTANDEIIIGGTPAYNTKEDVYLNFSYTIL